jgi:hypothetical protein
MFYTSERIDPFARGRLHREICRNHNPIVSVRGTKAIARKTRQEGVGWALGEEAVEQVDIESAAKAVLNRIADAGRDVV